MKSAAAEDDSLLDTVRRFACAELAPRAAALDEGGSVAEHLPRLAALGLLGMNLPERWGGAGLTARSLAGAVAELARACAATASMVTAHFLAADAILLAGDDAICERYLPAAAAGRALGAFALTEPQTGSNPLDMATSATPEGDGVRLRGVKHFISNGGIADFIVVFAKSDPAAGARGIDAFVLDKGIFGLRAAPPEPTMGLRASPIYELQLDCLVSAAHRLGSPGSGFKTALRALDRGRVDVAAMALGIASAALDAAVAWAKERRIDGHPLADKQGIQWMLADMATELAAARLLIDRAADLRESGAPFTREAAMAKLFATETAGRVVDRALQIHGGYGYSRKLPLERYARDVRVLRIYEGTSEIQRNIIARLLLQ
jgi:alkylation response protein AidB-like acyl-CoA dehydrogenase